MKYVSRDEVRFALLQDNDTYFANEKTVYKNFINTIQKYLDEGYSVIADATHINWASRHKLLNALCLTDVEVKVFMMKTNLAICIQRNDMRKGRENVPNEVIVNMHNRMQHPRKDPYQYAEIWNIYDDGTKVLVE